MEEREFHLCREPWIYVMEQDYQVKEVTLIDALVNADKYRGLAGETETQNIAIIRFLLAVLHTVFSRQNEKGEKVSIDTKAEALRCWGAIWEIGYFPRKLIEEYFSQWEDRFWLFDYKYPFYQVPRIEGTNNPAKKMNGAIVESSNKIQLFSMRTGIEKEVLSYAEAARWLIYLQAFGDTAAKKPSPKLCWVGSLGTVAAKGKSLFETLMLNLTLLKNGMEIWGEAKPTWERAMPFSEKLQEIPIPDNQPELLTMQCRRVLLCREQGAVTGYVEAAGEYIHKESAFSEQMTFWTVRKSGKGGQEYVPYLHEKARQMWRDFSSLVGDGSKQPGVVSWISKLQTVGKIPKTRYISFQIVGVEYGSMFCGMADEFSDELQFHISILNELGRKLQKRITDEVEHCNSLAKLVKQLAVSLDKATGGDGKSASMKAMEQAYYRLDIPFRQWLLHLDPEQNLEWQNIYFKEWRRTAKKIIIDLGQELVDQVGTAAISGRMVKEKLKNKEVEWHYSAPEAFNYFLYQIKKEVGV